jgi:hypothetical protein
MNDNIWHLRPRIEDALNPIFDLFDERQHCLLGMCKTRSNIGPQKRLRFAVVAE